MDLASRICKTCTILASAQYRILIRVSYQSNTDTLSMYNYPGMIEQHLFTLIIIQCTKSIQNISKLIVTLSTKEHIQMKYVCKEDHVANFLTKNSHQKVVGLCSLQARHCRQLLTSLRGSVMRFRWINL